MYSWGSPPPGWLHGVLYPFTLVSKAVDLHKSSAEYFEPAKQVSEAGEAQLREGKDTVPNCIRASIKTQLKYHFEKKLGQQRGQQSGNRTPP